MKLSHALLVLTTSALFAACSADPRLSSGLKVKVQVDASSKAQCVRVIATPETGTTVPTRAIARKDEILVAVYKGEDWSGKTTVVARGYADCADDVPNFIEESATEVREALEGELLLVLKGTTTVVDKDNDGKSGADDCDDNDPQRFVGNAELCTSTKDNNCSSTTGCADSACTGTCAANGVGTCQSGVCIGTTELSCVDGQDNDNDGLVDCVDPDCGGSSCNDGNACTSPDVCLTDGGCAGAAVPPSCGAAPAGTCLFGAGSCNPADGGCLYRARDAGTSCNADSNACTQGDVCLTDGGCNPGTPKVCTYTGANPCRQTTGQCLPLDAGCVFPPATGATCNDLNPCTDMDVCLGDAGCAGAPKVCYQTANPCKVDAGSCTAGTCNYGNIANNTACDDGDQCTLATTCTNGQCLNGTPQSCPAQNVCQDAGTCSPTMGCVNPPVTCVPNECQTGGVCMSPGGCSFTEKNNGTACSIGTCQSGVCTPSFTRFSYVPSNFNPDAGYALPLAASTLVELDCGTATLTTGTPGGGSTGVVFTACGKGTTTPVVITQENGGAGAGIEAVLLPMRDLRITSSGKLTVTGGRPVILAVYGRADIEGEIEVSAAAATGGPGANLTCATGTGENGFITTDGTTGLPTTGGTGAAGGGHASTGGTGGDGDGLNTNPAVGTAANNDALQPLAGGCPGGLGGSNDSPGQKPKGGGGGGAVQLSAAGLLKITTGKIYASGGGGQGGRSGILGLGSLLKGEGGGGAGAGGAILLEGANITLDNGSRITANGGAGGEGGEGVAGSPRGANGPDGAQGTRTTTTNPGNLTQGGAGGTGGAGNTKTGSTGSNDGDTGAGGGGGGGAVGRVRINTPGTLCRINGHVISPSANAANDPHGSDGFTLTAGVETTSGCL